MFRMNLSKQPAHSESAKENTITLCGGTELMENAYISNNSSFSAVFTSMNTLSAVDNSTSELLNANALHVLNHPGKHYCCWF